MPFLNLFFLLPLTHAQGPMVFKGQDLHSGKPCFLKILNETSHPYSAHVQTSYAHGHESSPLFKVQYPHGRVDLLVGKDLSQTSELAIFLKNSKQPDRFNIKWKHGNHFHSDSCQNLQAN